MSIPKMKLLNLLDAEDNLLSLNPVAEAIYNASGILIFILIAASVFGIPLWDIVPKLFKKASQFISKRFSKGKREGVKFKMSKEKKPNAFFASILSVLALLGCYISYGALNVILSLVLYMLWEVPVVGVLIKLLISKREQSADEFVLTIAMIISLLFVCLVLSKVVKNEKTLNLSLFIFGVLIIVINGVALLGSIINGSGMYSYITAIIAGIYVVCVGRKNSD